MAFVKSDGTVDSMQVAAQYDGAFSFSYTPDVAGEWMVSIWCSGATYIMQSADLSFSVAGNQQTSSDQGIPTEYVAAAVVTVIVALSAVVAYVLVKRRDRSSPVVISD